MLSAEAERQTHMAAITVYFQTRKNVQLSDKQIFKFLLLEIMHCARNLTLE